MDPNAALRLIGETEDQDELVEACEALDMWLAREGFQPDWDAGSSRAMRRYLEYRRAQSIGDDWCGVGPDWGSGQ